MSAMKLDDTGVIMPCPHCGQNNRIPYSRLEQQGTCGRCEKTLPLVGAPVEIGTEAQFAQLLRESPLPIVVDFWAPWCGPCRMVAPELERVAAANAGTFLVVKINTEALPPLGARYGIQSIPTMAVFQKGQEAARTMGARPAAAITDFVNQALEKH